MSNSKQTAAEWLEAAVAGAHIAVSGMARNEAIACAAAAADLGVALDMLRDAKAELERVEMYAASKRGKGGAMAVLPPSWDAIERKWREGGYR